MAGRTSFVLAHRFSTLRHADWVVVMMAVASSRGEQGKQIASGGAFAELWVGGGAYQASESRLHSRTEILFTLTAPTSLAFHVRLTTFSIVVAQFSLISLMAVVISIMPGVPSISFSIEPFPTWVSSFSTERLLKKNEETGAQNLLFQQEIRNQTRERFVRTVHRIENIESLNHAANLEFNIEPFCESLAIHHVRLIRSGEIISEAQIDEFRVIQPEESRHRLVIDGTYRLIHLIDDARPGDIVDVASTTRTTTPIFPVHCFGTALACAPAGADFVRVALHFPTEPGLRWNVLGGDCDFVESAIAGNTTVALDRTDEPWRSFSSHAPPWFRQVPVLIWSSFNSWSQVSRSVAELWYSEIGSDFSDPSIENAVVTLQLEDLSRPLQIQTIIRFVRDQIRYFSISEGTRALVPDRPTSVLAKRYGDCKDKSILLVLMLQKIGINAKVALVNTSLRERVTERLPAPEAFDHAIVMFVWDAGICWVDATATGAGGDLNTMQFPNFGLALPVTEVGEELHEIRCEGRPPSKVRVEESIILAETDLLVTITTRAGGREADAMRSQRNLSGVERFNEGIRKFSSTYYRNAEFKAPVIWDDDLIMNQITMTEKYRAEVVLQCPTSRPSDQYYPVISWLLDSRLPRLPKADDPSAPVALPGHLDLDHEIRFLHQFEHAIWNKEQNVINGPGFHYMFSSVGAEEKAEFRFSFTSDRSHIEPGEFDDYRRGITGVLGTLTRAIRTKPHPIEHALRVAYIVIVIIAFAATNWLTYRDKIDFADIREVFGQIFLNENPTNTVVRLNLTAAEIKRLSDERQERKSIPRAEDDRHRGPDMVNALRSEE